MKTITNNVPRDIIDAWELSEKERADFDYLDWPAILDGRDSASFFRYRGTLYDLSCFMRLPAGSAWDGGMADSAFSSVVVRFVDDNERVVVGVQLS